MNTNPNESAPEPNHKSALVHGAAAVILVAGVGSRLRPLTDDRPKALLEIDGETILARAVRLLTGVGIGEFVLATGYREEQVRRALAGLDAKLTFCENPRYASTQNSVSLALCRQALRNRPFFKLDGDLVFQPEVLDRLLASDAELAVAVDSKRALDAEAMKVCVAASGRISAFGKQLPFASAQAETIGIEWLSARASEVVLSTIEAAVNRGKVDLYYEDYYSELVRTGALQAQAVEVGDLRWAEVDTLEDLERARGVPNSRTA